MKIFRRNEYKRYLLAIVVGAIVWNILFFLPVRFLSTLESESINTVLTLFAFLVAPFICGYIAGYIGREKEMLLSVIAVILGYSPWTLIYFSVVKRCFFLEIREIYSVMEYYIYFLIFSVLGGLLAMKKRKNKLRGESKSREENSD
jgi:MFS family permease